MRIGGSSVVTDCDAKISEVEPADCDAKISEVEPADRDAKISEVKPTDVEQDEDIEYDSDKEGPGDFVDWDAEKEGALYKNEGKRSVKFQCKSPNKRR